MICTVHLLTSGARTDDTTYECSRWSTSTPSGAARPTRCASRPPDTCTHLHAVVLLPLAQPAPVRTASERPRRAPQYGYLPAHLVAAFGGRAEVVQRIYDTYPEGAAVLNKVRAPPPDSPRPHPAPPRRRPPAVTAAAALTRRAAAAAGQLAAAAPRRVLGQPRGRRDLLSRVPRGRVLQRCGCVSRNAARPTPPAARAPRLKIRASRRRRADRMRPIDRAREMGWPTIVTLLESVEGKPYDEWRAAHPELAALDDDHAPGLNGSNGAGPSTPSGRSERAADDLARLTIKIDEEEKVVQDEYEEQGTWADLPNDDPAYVAPPPPVDPRTQVPGRGPGSSGSGPNRGHFR